MKKLTFILLGVLVLSYSASAQRYAYVDTEYILKNLASYEDAQKELDRVSTQWQNEIEERYEAIDRLYKAYQAEKVLLTEEMRAEREEEIIRKEAEAKELQRQRFGVEGDLFKRRQELIQPIQEEIYNAIKEVAQGGGYSVIFDKANQSNILYADPRYDKSDRVLSRLGVSSRDRDDSDDDDPDSGSNSNTSPQRSGGTQSPSQGGSDRK
jgi:outer membrane protein